MERAVSHLPNLPLVNAVTRQRRLEIVLVLIVALVLLGVLLRPVGRMLAEAERAAVQQEVGMMRAAVSLQMYRLLIDGRRGAMAAMLDANPVDWLAAPPRNYLGAQVDPEAALPSPRSWFFDLRTGCMVYVIDHDGDFTGSLSSPARLRFRIAPMFTDADGNGRYDPGREQLEGVILQAVDAFEWLGRSAL